MTSTPARRSRQRRSRALSPDEYGSFIGQIELEEIWLGHAEVENAKEPGSPLKTAEVAVGSGADWTPDERGFRARHRYTLDISDGDEDWGSIRLEFNLRFRSQAPMTDDIFDTFKDVNLPVNTWPYLREFVASMTGRMGWAQLTLPALKRVEGGLRVTNVGRWPPTAGA
ncbi:MAG TPA: hypothetical protein VK821_20400 [Dehalococcoidia bacterium]|nr:hypothetical protein [Dehalococcoidia bacterium]